MKRLLKLAVIPLFLIVNGCQTESGPVKEIGEIKGKPVKFGEMCDHGNNGKTLETEGFLSTGNGVFCSRRAGRGRMECRLRLTEFPGSGISHADKPAFDATVAAGSGASSMDRPESDYPKEIKVRDNDGNPVDLSKKVTVTVELESTTDDAGDIACFLSVLKIRQGEK